MAVGMNDLFSMRKITEPPVDPETGKPKSIGNSFFANYYVSVSKHFDWEDTVSGYMYPIAIGNVKGTPLSMV